jgi:hypothetical protein
MYAFGPYAFRELMNRRDDEMPAKFATCARRVLMSACLAGSEFEGAHL